MTIPYWPSDLPQRIDTDQFSTGTRDGRLQTPMEAGPPKVRRRNALSVQPMSGILLTDFDGYARLLRFWDEELDGGVLPFIIPDQIMDQEPLTDEDGEELTDEDDEPLLMASSWLVQFASPPVVTTPSGKLIRIGITLNILP